MWQQILLHKMCTTYAQGMFLVSFPYTVSQGGYWALIGMVVVGYICCHTGKILIDCLYDVDSNGERIRVRSSYVEIAQYVWGARFGGWIVNTAQIIELLMTCILYVLLCGELLLGSLPHWQLDLSSWIMISTLPLLACAFLTSMVRVSMLSFWCSVTHLLVNVFIIFFCLTRANHWHWADVKLRVDIWTLPIALGVIVFSYTSHIFLPTLEGSMSDRSKFHSMMYWTHVVAAVAKIVFSYVGFLTWGTSTEEVITNNLPNASFKLLVNVILSTKALLSYPLPFYAAVGLLEDTFCRFRCVCVCACVVSPCIYLCHTHVHSNGISSPMRMH